MAVDVVEVECVHQHALVVAPEGLDQVPAMVGDEAGSVEILAGLGDLLQPRAIGADDRHDVGDRVALHGAPPRLGGVQFLVVRL